MGIGTSTTGQRLSEYQRQFETGPVTVGAIRDELVAREYAAFIANMLSAGGGMPEAPKDQVTFQIASDVNPALAAALVLSTPKIVLR